ncbi:DMT family transporter [Deferribacteraceae bacterium V6Fe1]|nr:DMT family transporter [Deferribacteraceae bacterium V6Fe1]
MPYLLLALSALFWSGNFVLSKGMAASIPPIALVFWRWTVAGIILAPFVLKKFINNWDIVKQHTNYLLAVSFLGVTTFNALVYMAMHYTTAVNAVLVNSFTPVIIFIFSALIYKERITFVQLIGIIVSISGVFTIMTKGDLRILLTMKFNFGDILILLAATSWALYSVLLKSLPKEIDRLTFLMTIIIYGTLMLLPFYLIELYLGYTFSVGLNEAFTIGYVAVFASVLAFICWNRAVREVGANKAGPMVHLMPVFGTILSYIFLKEKIYLFHITGILLVFTGIFTTGFKLGRK